MSIENMNSQVEQNQELPEHQDKDYDERSFDSRVPINRERTDLPKPDEQAAFRYDDFDRRIEPQESDIGSNIPGRNIDDLDSRVINNEQTSDSWVPPEVIENTNEEIYSQVDDQDVIPQDYEHVQTHEINDESSSERINIDTETVQIRTSNEALENQKHPETGVPFVRKTVELPGGKKVEGVFAVFKSEFTAKIPENMYLKSDKDQFKECNKQLLNEIENNPEMRDKFSEEQIDQIKEGIKEGTAPEGYVWHHNEEAGTLQLVDAKIHAGTGHTGGRAVWGGGKEHR